MGRRGIAKEEELNLVPVMNLVSILIPFLVLASSQMQIAVIDTVLPPIGKTDDTQVTEVDDDDENKPLSLTVYITEKGFDVEAKNGRFVPEPEEEEAAKNKAAEEEGEEDDGKENIPCVKKTGKEEGVEVQCTPVRLQGKNCQDHRAQFNKCADKWDSAEESMGDKGCVGEYDGEPGNDSILDFPGCTVDNYDYNSLKLTLAQIKAEMGQVCPWFQAPKTYMKKNEEGDWDRVAYPADGKVATWKLQRPGTADNPEFEWKAYTFDKELAGNTANGTGSVAVPVQEWKACSGENPDVAVVEADENGAVAKLCDTTVILIPSGRVSYRVLVNTMDALRADSRGGSPVELDQFTPGWKTQMEDDEVKAESIQGLLGQLKDESSRPAPDARVDHPGQYVLKKYCSEGDEQEQIEATAGVVHELFSTPAIAGGVTSAGSASTE